MFEEMSEAESVTSPDAPVAVDPALLNKPVHPSQEQPSGSADDELLRHKLGLANQHAKQAKREADDYKKQLDQLVSEMAEIKSAQTAATQKSLEEQGQFRQLWEDTKQTVSTRDAEIMELRAKLASVTEDREQDRLRSASISQISGAGAVNSDQLYHLLSDKLRQSEEGKPMVLNGGIEQPLSDYLANLKQASEWQHHFSASGSKGIGSTGGTSVAPGMDNPYRSGNLTEAMKLEVANPELAKQLKAEAARG